MKSVLVLVKDSDGSVVCRAGTRSSSGWHAWARAIAKLTHEAQYGLAGNSFSTIQPVDRRPAQELLGKESCWDFGALHRRLTASQGPKTLPELLLEKLGHGVVRRDDAELVFTVRANSRDAFDLIAEARSRQGDGVLYSGSILDALHIRPENESGHQIHEQHQLTLSPTL